MPETISPEVECLKLKAAINENHRLAQKSAGDAIERAILAGQLLAKWKELLPHGKFEAFVSSHFDGSKRTAQTYMTAAKGLKALPNRQSSALLATEDTMEGLLKRLKKDDGGTPAKGQAGTRIKLEPSVESQDAQPDSISEKGKPGGEALASSDETPVSSGPASEEAADSSGEDERTDSTGQDAQERDPRPPRSGKDKPGKVDYGKCPNCAGVKWTEDEFGVTCSKCHHPHGEPVGDRAEDEDPAETLRSKTVKTSEALMRCFDDLQLLVPKSGTHKQCIELCKSLLKSAKSWK